MAENQRKNLSELKNDISGRVYGHKNKLDNIWGQNSVTAAATAS